MSLRRASIALEVERFVGDNGNDRRRLSCSAVMLRLVQSTAGDADKERVRDR
jgi:hypothetical protein